MIIRSFGLKEEVYEKIKRVVEDNNKYNFKIFGSRAREDFKNSSDIDIAIFENVSREDEYKIRNEMDLLDIIYKDIKERYLILFKDLRNKFDNN